MPGRRKLSPSCSASATPAPWFVILPCSEAAESEQSPAPTVADTPGRLSTHFSPDDLPGQFVLSRSDEAVPPGWVTHRLRGWTLGAHPWLPVTRMYARDSTEAGWLLGFPINERSEIIEGAVHLPFDRHAVPHAMESWLSRLCGRFLAIWLTPTFERVYLDAAGLLGAVFAREHDLVASTTALVPYTRGCQDDIALLRRERTRDVRAVLGFGKTSRYGVERLHPTITSTSTGGRRTATGPTNRWMIIAIRKRRWSPFRA